MSVYVLTQLSCYIYTDEISESKLCTSYTLRLARKHIPAPFLSKESNKSLRIHLIKHRNGGDLQSHLEPCPPFSASCQCLYYREEVARSTGELTGAFLLASLPITALPCEYLDCVLTLRRSSFPSVTPNAATTLKEEREREKANK